MDFQPHIDNLTKKPTLFFIVIVILKIFSKTLLNFREKWEINLIIWLTVPRSNPSFFAVSVKLKVPFQSRFEVT